MSRKQRPNRKVFQVLQRPIRNGTGTKGGVLQNSARRCSTINFVIMHLTNYGEKHHNI